VILTINGVTYAHSINLKQEPSTTQRANSTLACVSHYMRAQRVPSGPLKKFHSEATAQLAEGNADEDVLPVSPRGGAHSCTGLQQVVGGRGESFRGL